MRFSELIAPVTAERFMSDFYGHKPLHVPSSAECPRAAMISWTRMNDLLSLRSHWTEANIKLIMNSRPVSPEHYIREVDTLGGTVRRADLAKVDLFMAMGASLVANSVEDVSPEVRAVISSLGDQFSARAGANIYCSFKDVQAFASHCDLHEVFAVQCEGEKVWNIYENRAAAPVEALTGADAQAIIDRAKGRILHQVRMRPGDLLYIPRGYYHDALASSGASLHVTFSVTPLNGRILFRLLEEAAVQDAAFRDYLPDAREANGVRLEERLADLAGRISALVTSNSFKTTVATRQRMLCDPNYQARTWTKTACARSSARLNAQGRSSPTRPSSDPPPPPARRLARRAPPPLPCGRRSANCRRHIRTASAGRRRRPIRPSAAPEALPGPCRGRAS
jgi:ribosomal protein L16 Arg81 hydroxylase